MKTIKLLQAGLSALAIALAGLVWAGAGSAQAATLTTTISQPAITVGIIVSGTSIGQSFTATATGVITQIRIVPDNIYGGGLGNSLSIYSGAGNGGTLLYTQAVTFQNVYPAFQTVTLTTPVPVVSGLVYTFYEGGCLGCETGYYGNIYAGGVLYAGAGGSFAQPSFDLTFEVVIEYNDSCTGQLNCGAGDEYVQFLNRSDSAGKPTLQLWCLTVDGTGSLAGVITQADINKFPAKPAENTLVKKFGSAEGCRVPVSFWILTTGEYQIVIGPNSKGDVIRTIFKGLPPTGVYSKKCNVLTSFETCE